MNLQLKIPWPCSCWKFKAEFKHLMMLFFMAFLAVPQFAKAIVIVGPTTVCQGDEGNYTFVASSSKVYVWNPGTKGNLGYTSVTGALGEGTIAWKRSGSSTITVTVIDRITGGIVETSTLNVTVLPRPNPVISWNVEVGCQIFVPKPEEPDDPGDAKIDLTNCIRVCEKSIVTYSVPVVAGSTYTWSVSGGIATVAGALCTVDWGAAGAGTIEVTETSSGGCVGKKFLCIEIVKKPTAEFEIMTNPTAYPGPVNACIFDNLVFRDLSSANGGTLLTSWFWDFGDGVTSADQNPTHAYTAAGTYIVKLKVTNECNCTSEYEMIVIVSSLTGIKIICPGLVCENTTAKYSVIDGCTVYNWSVIGGSILSPMPYGKEIQVMWNSVDDKGIGYVIFDATACSVDCPSKTVIKVPVMKTSVPIVGKITICTKKQYRYVLPQWPATNYNWTVAAGGTGAILIHTDQPNEIIVEGPNPGPITLTCNYTNNLLIGCTGVATMNINLENPPTFVGSKLFCEAETKSFSLSTGAVANWKLEGPSGMVTFTGVTFTYNYLLPGTYRLSAEGNFCWPEPLKVVVDERPAPPVGIFGTSEMCVGTKSNFTTKTGDAKSVFVWSVISGSGNINNTAGSSVTFETLPSGPWTLRVVTRNKKAPQCESFTDATKNITIPVVSGVGISGDLTPCQFTYNDYTEMYGGGYDYKWEIVPEGAGSIVSGGNGPSPRILWNEASPSPRHCVLKCEFKQCGVSYLVDTDIYIHNTPPPIVLFDSKYCQGAPVSPLGISTLYGGTIEITSWGDMTTDMSIPHKYENKGPYTITGVVVNPDGCEEKVNFSFTVEVNQNPVISLVQDIFAICGAWTNPPGAGQPSSVKFEANVIGTPAFTYDWRLMSGGGSLSSTDELDIYPPKPLGQTMYQVTVTDHNGCSAVYDSIMLVIQTCGGGGSGTSCVPTGSTTVPNNVVVNCTGTYTDFFSRSGTGFRSESWYAETLGDMANMNLGLVTVTFTVDRTKVGLHRFTYTTVYDNAAGGDPCTKSIYVNVYVPMYPGFEWTLSCGTGGKYNVVGTSNTSFYNPVTGPSATYNWYTSKWVSGAWTPRVLVHTGSTIGTPPLALDAGSKYKLILSVTTGISTSYTCEVEREIETPVYPVASFYPEFSPTCEGNAVNFISTSTPSTGLNFMWYFGDGENNTKNQRTYKNLKTADPEIKPSYLVVTDKYGCSNTRSFINILVYENKLGGIVSATPTYVCPNDPVTLNLSSFTGSPTSLVWMRDNTGLAVGGSSHIVTAPQNGNYYATLRDVHGCTAATSGTIVTVVNVPDVVIDGKPDVCVGEEFTLNAYTGPDILSYSWQEYSGGIWSPVTSGLPDYDFTKIHTVPGTYKYRVTITVVKTLIPMTVCSGTSEEFTVVVHDLPVKPSIAHTMLNCNLYELQLSASSSSSGSYTWSNGMSGTPVSVFEGGPYMVTLTDIYGCSSSQQKYILKDPKVYLWVFPTGCYTLCPAPSFLLKGPIIPFSSWQWRKNYVTASSGTGLVTPFAVTTTGVYNLYLNNGMCAATSGDLDFNAQGCVAADCNQSIAVNVTGVTYLPGCRARLQFSVVNWTGVPIPYTVTPSMGGFITLIGAPPMLMPGPPPNVFFAEWTAPAPSGFPSGTAAEFVVTVTLPGGAKCRKKIVVELNCPTGSVLHRSTDSSGILEGGSKLTLAPNPARDMTTIMYSYGPDAVAADRHLLIYDMVGRVLGKYSLTQNEGRMDLHFDEWTSGIYRVVLLDGNDVVQTTPLSITR